MFKKIHYGWVIVMGCFLISATGTSILVNLMGLFIKPVSSVLGFTRAEFSLVFTCSAVVSMLCAPAMGKLLQKYSSRLLVGGCAVLSAALIILYSFCTQLWQFYIVGAATGLCISGMGTLAISTILNKWFLKKTGLALGIASSGSGLGSMILTPIIASMIINVSWQAAYLLMAAVIFVINVPICIFMIKNKPEDIGLKPYGYDSSENGQKNMGEDTSLMNKEVMRMPVFWLFGFAIFLAGILGMGIQQHLYSYMTDIGYSPAFAAVIMSIAMGSLIFGKMLAGGIFDRFGMVIGSVAVCFACLSASVLLLFASHVAVAYLVAVIYGFGYTLLTIPPSYLTSNLLGNRDYSANYGIMTLFLFAGISLGSPIAALFYDKTGSYQLAWILFAVLSCVVLAILLYTINKFKNIRKSVI